MESCCECNYAYLARTSRGMNKDLKRNLNRIKNEMFFSTIVNLHLSKDDLDIHRFQTNKRCKWDLRLQVSPDSY